MVPASDAARTPRSRRRTPEGSATIYSVAEQAGVSIATVSRVLAGTATASPAAIEKVLAAARYLNYVPQNAARSLATRRTRAHALVIGSMAGPYWSEMILGYEEASAGYGQSLMLRVLGEDRSTERDLFDLRGRVDGVVINHPWLTREAIEELARDVPVAVVGRTDVTGCDVITSESRVQATELTSHLLAHGRRQLLFVGDPDAAGDVRERYAGFCLAQDLVDVEIVGGPMRVAYTEESGRSVVGSILARRPRTDAVVCANDELALAVAAGLRAAGVVVGEDVAVTGWDDVTTARYVTPGLTTVHQPIRQMGALAAELLHARISGTGLEPQRHILPSELVIRQSCGCP